MRIVAEKRLSVPGNPEISCDAWSSNGKWACLLEEENKLKSYRLQPSWRFYYPSEYEETALHSMMISHCEQISSAPNEPNCVFMNDYFYTLRFTLE